jgi:hypothetical protein
LTGKRVGRVPRRSDGRGIGVCWLPLIEVGPFLKKRNSIMRLFELLTALDEGVPITDPAFYSDPKRCPDSFIEHVFRPSPDSKEMIPLLSERIAIMRQVGSVLCSVRPSFALFRGLSSLVFNAKQFNGSYHGFFEKFNEHYEGRGTALQAVEMIVEYFPSFRDEVEMDGRKGLFESSACLFKC